MASKTGINYLRYIVTIFVPLTLLAFLTEMLTQPGAWMSVGFWASVIANILPAVIVLGLVWWLAGRFVTGVYKFPGFKKSLGFITRHRFGRWGRAPYIIVGQGKILFDPHDTATHGGPGTFIIHNDTAIVLEKKGALTRVLGPGFPTLDRFEKIYDIIDLRPKRWSYVVGAMTKEGIPVTWDVEVQYQIDDGGQKPTEKVPYPYSEEAVFKAAAGKWRRERGRLQEMDWEGWVIVSQTEGMLRSILARRELDELIGVDKANRLAAREAIQEELAEALHQAAPKMGAKILEVKLDTLKVDDDVTQQWIQDWQMRWSYWSTNQLAKEEAEHIQAYEIAKAEAQILPLNLLTAELQKLDSEEAINSILTMRLASVLDRARFENEMFAPVEALDALAKLQTLLDHGINPDEHESVVEDIISDNHKVWAK